VKRPLAPLARRTPARRRIPSGARHKPVANRLAARRPGAPARRERARIGTAAAALLAVAALAWLLWPTPSPPPAAPVSPPVPEVKAAASREPRKIPPRRPPPAATAAAPGVDEARVRAAVLVRAAGLRACPVPPGAPSQVPVRLNVPASGEVRSVQLGGAQPLPPSLAGCLREKLLAWRFDDLHLASDVDLFATFALR